MASRVPAWKRLGLKLKSEPVPEPEDNTPDVPIHTYDSVAPPTSAIPVTRKRSRSPEVASSKAAKKAKKALKSSDPAARDQSPRKAVAFAPDAKTEDGDSIKQLFGAWVAEQKRNDPTFVSVKDKQPALSTPEPSKVSETADDNLTNKERRVQRVTPAKPVKSVLAKPAKPIKPPKIPKGQKPKPFLPALAYLKTFHEDKANWKFNKINQTLVLKHAFDIDLIPAEYNNALHAYVAGLKGLGRVHLRDRALEIRDKDVEEGINGFPETMDDREKRQEEYEEAVKEYVATCTAQELDERVGHEEALLMGLNPHQAMKSRMEKRMRVERILQTLASTPGDPTDYVPPKENLGVEPEKAHTVEEVIAAAPLKKVRNRKQRTAVFEDSDSSSSDDSSDSDSESEDEGASQKSKKAADADVAAESDSDSSDSDSDIPGSDSEPNSDSEDESEADPEEEDSD